MEIMFKGKWLILRSPEVRTKRETRSDVCSLLRSSCLHPPSPKSEPDSNRHRPLDIEAIDHHRRRGRTRATILGLRCRPTHRSTSPASGRSSREMVGLQFHHDHSNFFALYIAEELSSVPNQPSRVEDKEDDPLEFSSEMCDVGRHLFNHGSFSRVILQELHLERDGAPLNHEVRDSEGLGYWDCHALPGVFESPKKQHVLNSILHRLLVIWRGV